MQISRRAMNLEQSSIAVETRLEVARRNGQDVSLGLPGLSRLLFSTKPLSRVFWTICEITFIHTLAGGSKCSSSIKHPNETLTFPQLEPWYSIPSRLLTLWPSRNWKEFPFFRHRRLLQTENLHRLPQLPLNGRRTPWNALLRTPQTMRRPPRRHRHSRPNPHPRKQHRHPR